MISTRRPVWPKAGKYKGRFMWSVQKNSGREITKRAHIHGDHGEKAYRVRCDAISRSWPIPFGSLADAERAAKLFNELCPVLPGMSLAETRAMVFEAMGGSYESVRRYVVERVCRW